MDPERLFEIAESADTEIVTLGAGHYNALVGVVWVSAEPKAVYDEETVLENLMKENNWTREEALDWFGYNMDDGLVLFLTK